MGSAVADGVRDNVEALDDLIDDAALLVSVLDRMEGIGGAASVTSQLHYKLGLDLMHLTAPNMSIL